MKKEERLNRLFGEIDDDLVADAANRPIPHRVWLPRVTAAVAAVALSVGLAVTQPWLTEKPPLKDTVITATPSSTVAQTTVTTGSHEDLTIGTPVEDVPQIEDGNEPTQSTTTDTDKNVPVENPTEDSLKQPETEPVTEPGIYTTTTVVKNTSVTQKVTTNKSTDSQKTTTTKPTTQKTTTAKPTTQKTTADAPVEVPTQTEPDNEPTQSTTIKPTATDRPTGGTPTSTAPTNNEIWYEQHWEDKPIWQKFPQFERFDIGSYTVHDVTISEKMVEEHLENVNLYGYDIYTETGYDIVGKIYRIKGINPACAVALQYPDRTDFFPAVCSKYFPATLGEFITDLSLREHLRVGTVYHSYRDADGVYHDKEYAGLTVEKVWEMLLSDESLPNVHDDMNWQFQFDTKLSIRIDMPLLGYENISISLSENGYLRTNLLDTEKLFYIGEDKVDAFMAYVEENCRLQKDDELIPMPDDTNADTGTTMTTPAQKPRN